MPTTAYDRACVRAWLRYIEEVPTAAIRIPSFNGLFLRDWRMLPEQARERYIATTPLRKGHCRRFGSQGFSKDQVDESTERLRQTVERVDAAVAKASWLAGEEISLADLCVTPTIVRMSDLRLEGIWSDLRHFQDWYRRIQTRPSFATAYYAGSRVPLPRVPLPPE